MSELWLTAGHIEDVAETSKSQETSFVLGWPTTNVVATFMYVPADALHVPYPRCWYLVLLCYCTLFTFLYTLPGLVMASRLRVASRFQPEFF